MGRPQVRLQTESKTNRMFIAIRIKRNGKTSYPKVYLRTKNEEVARRRLIALDGVDDVEEARRRIDYLASAASPEQEKKRLADFLHHAPYIPVMTIEEAREELDNMFGGFVDEEPPSEELLDRWRRADGIEERQPILKELGADSEYLLLRNRISAQIWTVSLCGVVDVRLLEIGADNVWSLLCRFQVGSRLR